MSKISKRLLLLFILSTLVVTILTGCGSKGPEQTTTTEGPAVTEKNKVIIQNFNFIPNTITIKKGETLTWVNNDANPHFILGKDFMSGDLNIRDSFSYTFKEAGTFQYTCSNHSEMKALVIVK